MVSVEQEEGCQTRFLSALGILEYSIEHCQAEEHLARLRRTWGISGQLVDSITSGAVRVAGKLSRESLFP